MSAALELVKLALRAYGLGDPEITVPINDMFDGLISVLKPLSEQKLLVLISSVANDVPMDVVTRCFGCRDRSTHAQRGGSHGRARPVQKGSTRQLCHCSSLQAVAAAKMA